MLTYAELEPERVSRMERELGLRVGFLEELETGDDWSYVVRLHALLEAGAAEVLISAIGERGLDKVLHAMPLGSHRAGKLAFLRSLKALGDSDIRFIRFMSELYACLVRQVRTLDFSIRSYLGERTDAQLEQIYSSWGLPRLDGAEAARLRRIFRESPKLLIQMRALRLLELVRLEQPSREDRHFSEAELREWVRRAAG